MLAADPSETFDVARIVTTTGSGYVAAAAAGLGLGVWLRTRAWRLALLCVGAPANSALCEIALKQIVGRSLPATGARTGVSGFGFPSGHTSGSTAFATALIVVAWLLVRHGRARVLVTTTAVVYATVIGLSRVVVGAHHAADVVGGWLLATAITLGLASVLFARSNHEMLDDRYAAPSHSIGPCEESGGSSTRAAGLLRSGGFDQVNVTVNRAPGVFSTVMLPPCATTMARLIANPSPAPPVSRTRASSSRANRSKICS